MANRYPKLVNKQFNSPIGLYSEDNIREVIERESQLLQNGAVGVNFYNPNITTPANLKNSAVMRLIQEEQNEQTRSESYSNERTHEGRQNWPPPDNKQIHKIQFGVSGLKRVAWPPPSADEHLVAVSPDQVEQDYQQQRAAAQARSQPVQPQRQFEPPPQTITLRSEAPMSQAPAPVYNAQPAAKVLKGGKFLRGDLKWPPPEVRQHMEEERRHIEELSKGPAFRPRKLEKDYTEFFAQHALGNTYPSYKVPPGTLYYPHEPKYIKLS